MTMLEKIARAVDPWAFDPDNSSYLAEYNRGRAIMSARAALMAMREPDGIVLAVMRDAFVERTSLGALRAHTAMIDAILAGETGR